MSLIDPIFAVLPEPCLSLAIFHFGAAKKSKFLITDVIDFRLSTFITCLSIIGSIKSIPSSSSSLTL